MYYDVEFLYNGKKYKREVCRGWKRMFIMNSKKEKGVEFYFEPIGDKSVNFGWVQTNGPEIPEDLFKLIAEQLEKLPNEVEHKRIPKYMQKPKSDLYADWEGEINYDLDF